MNRLFQNLLYMFFPRRCLYCDRVVDPDELCCRYCLPDVPYMKDPICYRCGRSKSDCVCRGHRRQYDRCIAALRYEDGAARAVLALKHTDDAVMVESMATEMVHALRTHTDAASYDIVTFVPMHKKEERARMYNQSKLLARSVASKLGIPLVCALTKLYDTQPQKALRQFERSGNLLGVFDLLVGVDGKTILLVDDVITTGATLHECAKMLKIGGAKSVTALVFAGAVTKDTESD